MLQRSRLYTNVTCARWMLDQQRDLHLILKSMRRVAGNSFESEFVCPMANNLLPQVLDEWLQRELPSTPVGIVRKLVFHSKHYWESWFIPYVDFDPQGLARYIEVWEGVDQRGFGAKFRKMTLSYSKWRQELATFKIYDHPRQSTAAVLWFDTPAGLFWCPWDRPDDYADGEYRQEMIWLRMQELFPSLVNAPPQGIASGTLMPDIRNKAGWMCIVNFRGCSTQQTASELRSMYESNGPVLTSHQRKLCTFLGVDGALVNFANSGWD